MNLCVIVTLLVSLFSNLAIGSGYENLQKRLSKIRSFHATFNQIVIDSNGNKIHDGQGELWVKRPNKFNCHIFLPDENVIISDSKNLWIYNPSIKQVSIKFLDEAINQAPFLLILRNHMSDRKNYIVKQNSNYFKLIPKEKNNNVKYMMISVMPSGKITEFIILEKNGQSIRYQLQHYKNVLVSNNKFIFTIPKGIMIDDLR